MVWVNISEQKIAKILFWMMLMAMLLCRSLDFRKDTFMKAIQIGSRISKKKSTRDTMPVTCTMSDENISTKQADSNHSFGSLYKIIPDWAWYLLGHAIESQNRGGKP